MRIRRLSMSKHWAGFREKRYHFSRPAWVDRPLRSGRPAKKLVALVLSALIGAGLVVTFPQSASAASVNFATLAQEMVNRDALAIMPNYKSNQTSSYDRSSQGTGWYSNGDWSSYIRTETNGGRTEGVMLDADGPGAFTRFWLGGTKQSGTIRFYVDGSSTPSITENLNDLMLGNSFVKAPFVYRAGPDLAADPAFPDGRDGGLNFMLPIPYSSHLKITYDKPSADRLYYNMEYRTYDPGTAVTSFQMSDYTNNSALLTGVASQLSPSTWPPSTTNYYTDSAAPTLINQTVNSGSSVTANLPGGSRAVRFLKAQLGTSNDWTLRGVRLSMTFDGEQTVEAPIGDFFGSGQGLNPGTNNMLSVASDGTMTSKWTMPYQASASVTVTNTTAGPINVLLAANTGAWTWNSDSMHFRATYIEPGNFISTHQDLDFLTALGTGVYVGDVFSVYSGGGEWWGEGDEKVFVDGDYFPSHFGTGSEDYFGYAWGHFNTYQNPWTGQFRAADGPGYTGTTVLNRVRLLDGIPFSSRIQFSMELLDWTENNLVGTAHVALWYAKPGARVLSAPESGQGYMLQNQLGQYAKIDGGSTIDGAKLVEWTGEGGLSEQFRLKNVGGAYYSIASLKSGKVLEVPGGTAADLTPLQQRTSDDSAAQQWSFKPIRNGYYQIINRASGKMMDTAYANTANGTPIIQYYSNGSAAQLWKLIPIGIKSGTTYTLTAKISNKVMEVAAYATNDGAGIVQWAYAGGPNQQFKVIDAGNGYYRMENVNSGKVVEVPGGAATDSLQLQQRTWDGSAKQLWTFRPMGNGDYGIISKATGKSIDVYMGSTANNQAVTQYPFNGNAAQLWKLTPLN
jgi:hypothetical protein